jgi:precorrin-2 methylase
MSNKFYLNCPNCQCNLTVDALETLEGIRNLVVTNCEEKEMKYAGNIVTELLKYNGETYHRNGPRNWSKVMGESIEPVYGEKEIELEKIYNKDINNG